MILALFGTYLYAAVPSSSNINETTATNATSSTAPLLTNISLYQFTAPVIQRYSNLPHGAPQYYPSVTYDELNFRILLPLSLFPISDSHTSYFYLDGIQLGCDGVSLVPSPGINSAQVESFACELLGLYPIGSLHNLTVIITSMNGTTFRLQTSAVLTYYEGPSAPATVQTTNSTLGLQLVLSLNTTTMQSGQTVNVTALILNTLPKENNISGANEWAIPSVPSTTSFPCATFLYYQVFQGYYSQSNLSSAGMLLQVSPVFQFLSCPIFQRSYYLFQPYSASAAVPIGFSNVSSSTLYQVTPMSISGYLSGNYSRVYNSSVFTQNGALPPPPFKSGIYTVIAGDEWGQVVLLHFTVRG